MSRLMPAEINVPTYVQRLLIVDRTAPQNEGFSVIEGILTGEAPFEVKNAVENAAKEILTRFDFKGSSAAVELKDKDITIFGDSDFQLDQVHDG